MWIEYNPNPRGRRTGDCVIRALSKVLDLDWEETFAVLTIQGFVLCDWGNANHVWGRYLRDNGFVMEPLLNTCPDCYTVRDFAKEHPNGKFVVATGTHVVAVEDGNYYDSWDSGDEIPTYFWREK